MIQRIIPSGSAASMLGWIGTHFHAFAAVWERRGSTTAILRRPSASPSVMRSTMFVGPKFASNGLVPK